MYFTTFTLFQGVDSSLIPTISFPAFATHEDVLCVETKANVVRRLKGRYGFKRFCRDGYKCVLEDSNRRYYRNGETKVTGMNFLYLSVSPVTLSIAWSAHV